MAHAKHDEVRDRYNGRCGYCGVAEEDVGGELTVDHYLPITAGGDDKDDNLVYACFRCNLFKGDFHPTDRDQKNGHFLLHPLRHDVRAHLRLDEATGYLQSLTETGRFHISLLQLNRPALVAYRLRQRHQELLMARKQLLEAEVRELQTIIIAQEKYITHLRHLVESESEGR